MVDLMSCPDCNFYPLEVIVFEKRTISERITGIPVPFCRTYCGLNNVSLKDGKIKIVLDCKSCLTTDILWGVILCPRCCSWYPIVLGLPLLYPSYLRDNRRIKILYNTFIKKFSDVLTKSLQKCRS